MKSKKIYIYILFTYIIPIYLYYVYLNEYWNIFIYINRYLQSTGLESLPEEVFSLSNLTEL